MKANSNSGRLLKDAELRAIGLLLTATSNLEGLLEQLIRDIAGLEDDVGRIFTDPMHISELITHRNTVIHGDWFNIGGLGAEVVRLKRGATGASNVKAADVLRIAKRIEKAHFDLTMYVFQRCD